MSILKRSSKSTSRGSELSTKTAKGLATGSKISKGRFCSTRKWKISCYNKGRSNQLREKFNTDLLICYPQKSSRKMRQEKRSSRKEMMMKGKEKVKASLEEKKGKSRIRLNSNNQPLNNRPHRLPQIK